MCILNLLVKETKAYKVAWLHLALVPGAGDEARLHH